MAADLFDKLKYPYRNWNKNSNTVEVQKVLISMCTNRGFLQQCIFSWSVC